MKLRWLDQLLGTCRLIAILLRVEAHCTLEVDGIVLLDELQIGVCFLKFNYFFLSEFLLGILRLKLDGALCL
jgi:hypothetical protein